MANKYYNFFKEDIRSLLRFQEDRLNDPVEFNELIDIASNTLLAIVASKLRKERKSNESTSLKDEFGKDMAAEIKTIENEEIYDIIYVEIEELGFLLDKEDISKHLTSLIEDRAKQMVKNIFKEKSLASKPATPATPGKTPATPGKTPATPGKTPATPGKTPAAPKFAPTPLDTFYIGVEDYGIREVGNTIVLSKEMLLKISGAKPLLKSPHNIPVGTYDTVYTTSDIHADLVVFSEILFNAGLTIAPLASEDDIFTVKWNPAKKKTLLVIVGDIVDGRRASPGELYEVSDATGDIELLLHIFLFNLRISARSHGSEVRFTIGNHDFHTVIQEKEIQIWSTHLYNHYVHESSKSFFGTRLKRRSCLLPFYEACPYMIITIDKEMAFIHASLHSETSGKNMRTELVSLQNSIDTKNNFSDLYQIDDSALYGADSTEQGVYSGLWNRNYSYDTEDTICPSIKSSGFNITIVGHCQTNSCNIGEPGKPAPNNLQTILDRQKASDLVKGIDSKCQEEGGCVLLGCDNKGRKAPTIAFVDISMSHSFSNRGVNRAEILLLEHDIKRTAERYYNKISRVETRNKGIILMWQAPQAGGSLKKKTRKRNKRKSKLRSRRI